MLNVTKTLIEYIQNSSTALDARDFCSRYTCDVISNCLFGIDAKSFQHDNAEIYEHSRKILQGIMAATASLLPRKMFPPKSERFFINLIRDSIEYRVSNKIERDDFLAHVIAMQQKKNLSEVETLGQARINYFSSYMLKLF